MPQCGWAFASDPLYPAIAGPAIAGSKQRIWNRERREIARNGEELLVIALWVIGKKEEI